MKTRKFSLAQILTFVLAFVLTFAMAVPAFASSGAGPDNPDGKTLIKVLPSDGANTEFANRFQAYAIFTGTLLPTADGSTETNPVDPSKATALIDLTWSDEFGPVAYKFIEFLKTANIKDAGGLNPFNGFAVSESEATSAETARQIAKILENHADESEFVISFAKAVYGFITAPDNSITGTTSKWYNKNSDQAIKDGYWYFTVDDPGYYLIIDNYSGLRDKALEGDDVDASKYPAEVTGFILAVLGDQFVNMKSKTPDVEKDIVINSETGETSKGDTVAIGDEVTFKLTGTLPENYNQFDTFYYSFCDTLSKGLKFDNKSVKVYAVNGTSEPVLINQSGNYDVPDAKVDPETGKSTFYVNFPDLKTVTGVTITEATSIVVTYSAIVTEDAQIGVAGNPNTVDLTFSNNPFSDGKGTTTEKKVYVYSFGLDVTKYADDGLDEDGNPAKTLEGAEFVLMKDGQYAVFESATIADGKITRPQRFTGWTDDEKLATKLISDKEGKILVSGLDVGTYILKETKAPDGYNLMKPLEITISAVLNADGSLQSVSKQVTGVDAEPVVYTAATDEATEGVFSSGMIPIDPVNNKAPVLPGTGGIGLVIFYVLGGLLLVGAATYIIVSGRKKSKQQQQ